ncbi:hypothetical protein CL631_01855 [bacterium]|nr:hypothetical protein [bacterium]
MADIAKIGGLPVNLRVMRGEKTSPGDLMAVIRSHTQDCMIRVVVCYASQLGEGGCIRIQRASLEESTLEVDPEVAEEHARTLTTLLGLNEDEVKST